MSKYDKHKKAIIPWKGRLRGYRFLGIDYVVCDDYEDDGKTPRVVGYIWQERPLRFGWYRTQMEEFFFCGLFYFAWTWA